MTFEQFKETKYFESLDFLRFLSIIMVIWHHTGSSLLNHQISWLSVGHYGVDLFFAISGFLITTLLLRERDKNGSISMKRFFMRRTLRIFPLYYLVVGIYCGLVFFVEKDTIAAARFWENLPFYLTYTSNLFVELFDGRVIFYFAWSLATEEQFYLIWPLMMVVFKNKNAAYVLMFLTGLSILVVSQGPFPRSNFLMFLIAKIPLPICFASIMAIGLHYKSIYNMLRKILVFPHSFWFYLVLMFSCLLIDERGHLLMPIIMPLFVMASVLNTTKGVRKLTNIKGFVSMGVVSYGMYLFHMLGANVIKKLANLTGLGLNEVIFFIFTTIISYLGAYISFNTFEKYFLRLKTQYST